MKEANIIDCTNLGMLKDKSISKLQGDSSEFCYDNHNIRITAMDDNTSLTVTNEKGTVKEILIPGTLLGSCNAIDKQILFVANTNNIYELSLSINLTNIINQQDREDCVREIVEYFTSHDNVVNYTIPSEEQINNWVISAMNFAQTLQVDKNIEISDIKNDLVSIYKNYFDNLSQDVDYSKIILTEIKNSDVLELTQDYTTFTILLSELQRSSEQGFYDDLNYALQTFSNKYSLYYKEISVDDHKIFKKDETFSWNIYTADTSLINECLILVGLVYNAYLNTIPTVDLLITYLLSSSNSSTIITLNVSGLSKDYVNNFYYHLDFDWGLILNSEDIAYSHIQEPEYVYGDGDTAYFLKIINTTDINIILDLTATADMHLEYYLQDFEPATYEISTDKLSSISVHIHKLPKNNAEIFYRELSAIFETTVTASDLLVITHTFNNLSDDLLSQKYEAVCDIVQQYIITPLTTGVEYKTTYVLTEPYLRVNVVLQSAESFRKFQKDLETIFKQYTYDRIILSPNERSYEIECSSFESKKIIKDIQTLHNSYKQNYGSEWNFEFEDFITTRYIYGNELPLIDTPTLYEVLIDLASTKLQLTSRSIINIISLVSTTMQSPTIVFKPFYINQITSEVITGIIPLRLQVYTKDLSQIETIKSRLVTQFQLDIENAVLVSPLSYATHELSILLDKLPNTTIRNEFLVSIQEYFQNADIAILSLTTITNNIVFTLFGVLLDLINKLTTEVQKLYADYTTSKLIYSDLITIKISLIKQDGIYILEPFDKNQTYTFFNNSYGVRTLFKGNLNFNINSPIETLYSYESNDVCKVYWVDGLNPNRFINIYSNTIHPTDTAQFNCTGEIYTVPNVTITKDYLQSGTFNGGTIQYFITYYNQFGTETGIIWQSDLLYNSKLDRGCKEGETSSHVYKLTFDNIDTEHYEYLRLYALERTSNNGTPVTRLVTSIQTKLLQQNKSIIDNGILGEAFSTADVPYIGGLSIVASTIAHKHNTLFLGDITLQSTMIPEDHKLYSALQNWLEDKYENDELCISQSSKDIQYKYKSIPTKEFKGIYSYQNQLTNSLQNICGFKSREIYRFAILFLTSKSEWTIPIYIGDKYCDLKPTYNESDQSYNIPTVYYKMNDDAIRALLEWNVSNPDSKFILIRLLVASTTYGDRRILTQGVINPTMFNYYDRLLNKPHSINSWMFRPRKSSIVHKHCQGMLPQTSQYAEIQGITQQYVPGFDPTNVDENEANAYALILMLGGDWISKHNIGYAIYKYRNDGYINTCDVTDTNGNTIPNVPMGNQTDHNKLIDVVYNTYTEAKNAKEARSWLVSELGTQLKMTDGMLPSVKDFKTMVRTGNDVEPGTVWAIIGGVLATAAAIVGSVFTFGSAAPAAAVGLTAMWSSIIAGLCSTAAAVGTSAVATMASKIANAQDIDITFIKNNLYYLAPSFNHKNKYKKQDEVEKLYKDFIHSLIAADTQTNEALTAVFEFMKDATYNTLIGSCGRLTFKSPKELDAETKRELYYVDESVVTINTPEIDDIQFMLLDNANIALDIIGTIPINAAYGTNSMYTQTNGVASNASTLTLNIITDYKATNIEGLLNGGLYLDISLDSFLWDAENNHWSDITPSINLEAYKIFMWHRDTSWSCYIPGINIKDTILLSDDDNVAYINYIPATPLKKVFANLKYSPYTNYWNTFHRINVDLPKVIMDGDLLNNITINDETKSYYGNVHTLSINTDGYTLLKASNNNAFDSSTEGVDINIIRDPISIKFNSTPHAVLPLKWNNNTAEILPTLLNENPYDIYTLYDDVTLNTILSGFRNDRVTKTQTVSIQEALCEADGSGYQSLISNDTYYMHLDFDHDCECNFYCNTNMEFTNPLVTHGSSTIFDEQEGEDFVGFHCIIYDTENNVKGAKLLSYVNRTSLDITLPKGLYTVAITPTGYCYLVTDESHPSTSASVNISGEVYFKGTTTTHNINCSIIDLVEENPYLFIGELVKQNFDYQSWLGGSSNKALQLLTWNICSIASNNMIIDKTWGDTYYLRWDCLKTYPTTEQDKNSIVDVLSFMLETRINLDGRCDVNRGITNLVNARPTNFNLTNSAYSQIDNFFSYKILDKKFENNKFENQIVWSLTKTFKDDVDKWTLINTVNFLTLDGLLGPITKLLNVNDVLLAFQHKGISTINYDLQAALTTSAGVPLQLGNTNKVQGYTPINSTVGCYDKHSISYNETGLYFIDGFTKTMYYYDGQKFNNLSLTCGFETWFKDNVHLTTWVPNSPTSFKLSYDALTKDLYLSRNTNDAESCLVYNTKLNRFTSFMDYNNCPLITNIKNKSILFHQTDDSIDVYTMFEGEYNNLLDIQQPYWMTYRLNPSAYTDNTFTNFTYIADIIPSDSSVNDRKYLDEHQTTFTTIEAWNEYQHGMLDLTKIHNRKRYTTNKYRIWRGDIPRDGDTKTYHPYGGNRMRNPWLFLKLEKNTTNDTNKMLFHNLTVTYYK